MRGRILRGVETRASSEGTALRIRFAVPVRYVRHTPASHGDSVLIELTSLSRDVEGLLAGVTREALQPPRGELPIEAITYERDRRDGPVLRIDFARPVAFAVRQDGDLRSVVVTLPDVRREARRYVVQLAAAPVAAGLPALPDDLLEPGEQRIVVGFERDGARWERLRVGTYRTIREARLARRRLEGRFPGAFVLEAGAGGEPAATMADTDRPAPTPRGDAPAPAPRAGGEDGTPPAPRAPARPVADAETEARAERLLGEARAALTDGELDRAVALLTQIVALPENRQSPDAQELLGVARERKGQEAHAKAEYQAYLERYPEGEGAARVRQRLDALLTARAAPPPPLREPADEPRDGDRGLPAWQTFGSLSTSYRRDVRTSDGFGRVVGDSSVFSDVFAGARGSLGGWDVASELSGSYLWDLTERGDDVPRANTLFVEASDPEGPLAFGVGRQTGNTAGILGRYDGARLFYRVDPVWTVSVVGGLPVEPFETNGFQTDKVLAGFAADATGLVENLDLQLFAIHQRADGFTDRTAIGTEFSWILERLFVAGLVDVDVLYGELNTAYLVGNWQVDDATNLNLLLDYRNLPPLTTSNALIGQLDADDLGDLHDRFSTSEIERIAEDRTFRSMLATLGVTRQITDRWQLAADFTVSELSGTPESAGVPEFEGPGTQYDVFVQWIGTGLFLDRDVSRIGLRYVDAELVNTTGLLLSTRFPWGRRWRINPLLDLLWRDPDLGDDLFVLRPGLRVDYRLGRVTIDTEAYYEWTFGERFVGAGDEEGYTVLMGVRYDF